MSAFDPKRTSKRAEVSLVQLAERERESLRARTKKLDFKLTICDRARLPDQRVHPLFGHRAVTLLVDVDAAGGAGRLSVDQHAEFDGRSAHRRPHDKVKVAGVKAVGDASAGLVQCGGIPPHGPIAGQRPFIQVQLRGPLIRAGLVPQHAAGRGKIFGALEPDIVFRRLEVGPIGGGVVAASIHRSPARG